jgi:choline dehydrogenase-like flavoprotein
MCPDTRYRPVPAGTPRWGTAWKAATAKWYGRAMSIGASGSVMANRWNYYDLDPTYRNAFGQPLMRLTFDYKANEHKISRHAAQVINLFIMGASVFPHNAAYNPTGLVGALAYWAADAIRQRYLKHPGPLVQA